MSRKSAMRQITPQQHAEYLAQSGVTLIGGGLGEAPQAYKPILKVIEAQSDLVDILGTFRPRIVRMEGEHSHGKRKPVPEGIVDAESN